MPKTRKPSYLLHKLTGQARVRIDGKDHSDLTAATEIHQELSQRLTRIRTEASGPRVALLAPAQIE